MSDVIFEDDRLSLMEGETVLECLERHGHSVPNSCRSGVCQSCILKVVDGTAPAEAQKGLKDTQRAQGYFYSCLCKPTEELRITTPDDQRMHDGVIELLERLSDSVLGVTIRCESMTDCRAGQFVNLVHGSGAVRSYSVAHPTGPEALIQLHVGKMANGVMSGWLHDEARVGDRISLLGPHGNCFYVAGHSEQPLLLAGTGTGLAPLLGIAIDALEQGHRSPIHLFHGSLAESGLYLQDTLLELAERYEHFHYHPCALHGTSRPGLHVGAIDAYISETLPDLKGWRVYLCGPNDLVKLLQRRAFLAGASMKDILADAFLPAASPSAV